MRQKRWFEVNEIDFGDVGDFEKPEDNLFVRIIKNTGENSWMRNHIGEVFEVHRIPYEDYPDCYAVIKNGRRGDLLIPKEDCEIVPPPLQEGVEDFGDVGDFERPSDYKKVRYKKTGQIFDVERKSDYTWDNTEVYAIVKPKDLRGSKIAASACEPLELQEGTEDFGDVGDFEQPEPHYVPILEYLLEVDDNFQTFDDCIQHICEKFSITLEQLIQVCEDGLKGDYEGYEHLEFLTQVLKHKLKLVLKDSKPAARNSMRALE
jgi:hypothetical protein